MPSRSRRTNVIGGVALGFFAVFGTTGASCDVHTPSIDVDYHKPGGNLHWEAPTWTPDSASAAPSSAAPAQAPAQDTGWQPVNLQFADATTTDLSAGIPSENKGGGPAWAIPSSTYGTLLQAAGCNNGAAVAVVATLMPTAGNTLDTPTVTIGGKPGTKGQVDTAYFKKFSDGTTQIYLSISGTTFNGTVAIDPGNGAEVTKIGVSNTAGKPHVSMPRRSGQTPKDYDLNETGTCIRASDLR